MITPQTEADIYENEVLPRIKRMRERIPTAFRNGQIPGQPKRMDPNEGGLPLTPPYLRTIISHVLHELDEIEKRTGSDGMVRMLALFNKERAGTYGLHRIQCLEYMLFAHGLYMLHEIENCMPAAKAA